MSDKPNATPQIRKPRTVNFTDSAAKKVASLILEEENLDLKLRAFITGGGCSGFQYGFTFDEKIKDGDAQIQKTVCLEKEGGDEDSGSGSASGTKVTVTLLIDPMSYQYLVGADIDYKEDIEGARFVIRNPNAKTTCGCGQSFSV